MKNSPKNFTQAVDTKNQGGASLVEYALLVALIAVVAIVAIRTLGQNVSNNFSQVSSGVSIN